MALVILRDIYRDVYELTAKFEIDRSPSMLSTVLFMSVAQVLNLLTIIELFSVIGAKEFHLSSAVAVACLGVLSILNFSYCKSARIAEISRRPPRLQSFGLLYLFLTLISFAATAAALLFHASRVD